MQAGFKSPTGKAVAVAIVLAALSGCARPGADSKADQLSAILAEAAQGAQNSYDYEAAIRHFDKLYARDQKNLKALLGLARNLRYAGTPKDAIKLIKKEMPKHGERPALVLELAKAQLAASMLGDAGDMLKLAQRKAPRNWEVHATKGILLDRLKNFGGAQNAYRRAINLAPRNIAVRNNFALSLAQSGRLDEAIRVLTAVVESENATAQTRQNLALLLALKGDLKSAERLARQDLPSDAVAENMDILKRLGR